MSHHLTRRSAIKTIGLNVTAAAAPTWVTTTASAQTSYPAGRPVTIISPFGSSVDMFGRLVAEQLSKRLGSSFVVEQRLGAGGTVATGHLARQKPDGYTLGIGVNSTLGIGPHMYKNLGYRPQDLTFLAALMSSQSVLIVAGDRGIKTVRDLVELSRKRLLNFGSPGVGSGMHLSIERFNAAAGISNGVHVPFKSTETLTMALVGGDIDCYMSVTSASAALVKSGKLTAVAVSGDTRSPELPNVPTFAEIGLNNLDLPNFYGLIAPPGMPQEITARLHDTLALIAEDPDFRAAVTRTGNVPISLIGNSFKEAALADSARQAALIKKLAIEPQ